MMDEAGVEVAWFRKPLYLSPLKQNHRCHRKVLVTDEETAFTGGVGIAEEWCGDARDEHEWRDTHVAGARARPWTAWPPRSRRTGRSATTSCSPTATGSSSTTDHGDAVVQVVRGSASFGWQDMQTLLRVVLESAEERVRLSTAYFAPDAVLHRAAVRRGPPGRRGGDPAARPAHRQAGVPARRAAPLRGRSPPAV